MILRVCFHYAHWKCFRNEDLPVTQVDDLERYVLDLKAGFKAREKPAISCYSNICEALKHFMKYIFSLSLSGVFSSKDVILDEEDDDKIKRSFDEVELELQDVESLLVDVSKLPIDAAEKKKCQDISHC